MKFLFFLLFLWIIFALLDPDPGSGFRIWNPNPESESGIRIRIPDPDSESGIRIRIWNPNPESRIRIRNPESESGIQNPNPESGIRIRNPIPDPDPLIWLNSDPKHCLCLGGIIILANKILTVPLKNLKILLKKIQIAFNFVTLLISLYTSPCKGGV